MNFKPFFLFFGGCISVGIAFSQVSGNAQWNENNRFKQNSSYQKAAKFKTKGKNEAPMAYTNGDGTDDYIDNQLMNTITNNQSTYVTPFYLNPNGDDFVIKVNVLYNALPNNYTAIFHINQAGKKVQELDSLMQQRVSKLVNLASKIGIKRDQFYLDMIALVPIFSQEKRIFSRSYIQVPKGFEMQKNLHVRYTQPEQLDQLFSMAAQCEIYDLIKVEYQYDSTELAFNTMRERASAFLTKKTKNLQKMGIHLDTAYRRLVEQQNQFFPVDQYKPYNPIAVSALEDESNDASKVSAPQTRSTLFYNQISTDGFDIIINPSPLKPGLQLVYSMEMHYHVNPPKNIEYKTVKDTEMLLITPQGTIKELRK